MPAAKDFLVFLREIVAYDGDETHWREKTGRHGEIGGRAAKRAIHLPVRTFQSVECDGNYNEQGHDALLRSIFFDDCCELLLCCLGDYHPIRDPIELKSRTAFA